MFRQRTTPNPSSSNPFADQLAPVAKLKLGTQPSVPLVNSSAKISTGSRTSTSICRSTLNPPGSVAVTVTVVDPSLTPRTNSLMESTISAVATDSSADEAVKVSCWPSGSLKYSSISLLLMLPRASLSS